MEALRIFDGGREKDGKRESGAEWHMTTQTNLEAHKAICDELNKLYDRKNADYDDSFHKTFVEEGMAMSRIRLSDKLERFKRLSKTPEAMKVKTESIRDTLIDLANYAIMTIIEIDSGTEA